MNSQNDALTPPNRLALAYAKGPSRAFLELLLIHDVRLAGIVSNGKEPLIGQIRLAWWRDAIAKPAAQRPLGEPLLAQLTALDGTPVGGKAQAAMLQLVDAWGVLLAHEIWTTDVLQSYALAKAKAVFFGFADVAGSNNLGAISIGKAGEYWALASLLQHCQTALQYDAVTAALAAPHPKYTLSWAMRPLSILAFAARQDQINGQGNNRQGLRLIFNALTGW